MRWILWLGLMPLVYGVRLLWRWTVADRRVWHTLPESYRSGLALRVAIASVLVLVGLGLTISVFGYLGERLARSQIGWDNAVTANADTLSTELPPLPPTDAPEAVVDWFLHYDDRIADYRHNYSERLGSLRSDILRDLEQCPDAESLLARVDSITADWAIVLPEAAKRYQAGGPLPGETEEDVTRLFHSEAYLAAKMRVLGYFLWDKYGIDLKGRVGTEPPVT